MSRKYGLAYVTRWRRSPDISGRLGSIALFELEDPAALLAVAKGVISLRMIRHEIEVVR
jgi:hypothetical protein